MAFLHGGYVTATPGAPKMEVVIHRLGNCPNGHPLFALDNGPAEHILTADETRNRDSSKFVCQAALDQSQYRR